MYKFRLTDIKDITKGHILRAKLHYETFVLKPQFQQASFCPQRKGETKIHLHDIFMHWFYLRKNDILPGIIPNHQQVQFPPSGKFINKFCYK